MPGSPCASPLRPPFSCRRLPRTRSGMAGAIRSRSGIPPPMPKVRAIRLSRPCPLRRASFHRHAPTNGHFSRISPTYPPSFCGIRTASRLPETPPSVHFRFIAPSLKTNFPFTEQTSQKNFSPDIPTKTSSQTADVFPQKALSHKRCQTFQKNVRHQKQHGT